MSQIFACIVSHDIFIDVYLSEFSKNADFSGKIKSLKQHPENKEQYQNHKKFFKNLLKNIIFLMHDETSRTNIQNLHLTNEEKSRILVPKIRRLLRVFFNLKANCDETYLENNFFKVFFD